MTVVEDVRTDGSGLTEAAIQDLKGRLRGPLIVPGDADYAAARQVYNGMIDRYPRLIARCTDVADLNETTTIGAGFSPEITVDQTTGTVGLAYYNTAWAPSGAPVTGDQAQSYINN